MAGTLIPVVGPSGAGKDSLIDAARIARPDIFFPTRVITRPAGAGGEVFKGVDVPFFQELAGKGAFSFHWQAHGLFYGIPDDITGALDTGQHVIFNSSRSILSLVRQMYERVQIIVVTAPADVLAARLVARGRESADDIANRLRRADYAAPKGADVSIIQNSGTLAQGQAAFLAALPASLLAQNA